MVSQALQQVRARRGLGLGHAATLPREDDRLRQRGAGEAPVGGSGDAVWACEREVLEGAGEVEREELGFELGNRSVSTSTAVTGFELGLGGE